MPNSYNKEHLMALHVLMKEKRAWCLTIVEAVEVWSSILSPSSPAPEAVAPWVAGQGLLPLLGNLILVYNATGAQ